MHKDVIVVGAGISGIAAGYNLKKNCPQKSFLILEGRNEVGGTWDLFKYPGVRSDSDMHTLGFRFKPWIHNKSIADGPSIFNYLNETIDDYQLRNEIVLNNKVVAANWDSGQSKWHLKIKEKDQDKDMTCNFLFLCGGYFSYSQPHIPSFIGQENFNGQIIHPQFWSEEIDYTNKKIAVIGSGATAITLVPAIAQHAKHVVMIQRSPTYVVSRPSEDSINKTLKKFLPIKLTYFLVRWKNILWQSYTFFLARTFPQKIKTTIINLIKEELGESYDVKKHFTPSYNPWDQRVCLVPDSDLFRVIKNQKASVVTDTIKQFDADGILMNSGKKISADIIITATGIELNSLNDIHLSVDDKRVSAHKRLTYKGMMLSGVPNFALSFGYVNASWTLRADLTCEYVCKLINMMDKKRAKTCMPVDDKSAYGSEKLIDFNSGYVQRGLSKMPQQGNRAPWKNYQNYLKDIFSVRWMPITDPNLKFLDIED